MSQAYDQVDLRLLPPQLRKIASVVGIGPAMKLLKARGGTRMRVPVPESGWPLVAKLIGDEPARNLARVFQGQEHIDWPKLDKVAALVRNAEICARKAAGESLAELALEYDLTSRAIQIIVAAKGVPNWHLEPADSPQADLFGDAAPGDPVKDPFKNALETPRRSAGMAGAPNPEAPQRAS